LKNQQYIQNKKQQVPNNTRAIKMTTETKETELGLEVELERLDNDPEEKTIRTIGPMESIPRGVMISLFFGLFVGSLIYILTDNTQINFWGSFACGLCAWVWFFCKGINPTIETAFLGAIKCGEERIETEQLSEGWSWLFPWFYTHEQVSAKEETIVVGSEEKPLKILAVKEQESEDGTDARQIVEMTGKIIIRIKVWNAPLSLGFKYSKVEENVVNYVNSTLRQIASRAEKGYVDFVTNKHQIANRVFQDFKRVRHEANNNTKLTYSQQVENMGYRTVDVEFVKVDLPEAIKNATEGEAVEEAQRKRDMTETETFEMICKRLKIECPELNDQERSNRAFLLMGKPVNIYEGISGGNVLVTPKQGG
jgi:hypothetical protein